MIDGAVGWRGAGDGGRGVDRRKAGDKVRRHVVGRISAVLIGHLCGEDCDRAVSFGVKSVFGLIVKVVGPPVTTVSATFRVPLFAQTIWNQLPVTLTGSLKVIETFVFSA